MCSSDLVDREYQRRGIGRDLIRRTQAAVGDEVSLILMAAPGAMTYYPRVGFERAANAFYIRRKR